MRQNGLVADDFRSSIWFAIAFGYFVVIGAALGFITDQESSGTTRWLAGASWLGVTLLIVFGLRRRLGKGGNGRHASSDK